MANALQTQLSTPTIPAYSVFPVLTEICGQTEQVGYFSFLRVWPFKVHSCRSTYCDELELMFLTLICLPLSLPSLSLYMCLCLCLWFSLALTNRSCVSMITLKIYNNYCICSVRFYIIKYFFRERPKMYTAHTVNRLEKCCFCNIGYSVAGLFLSPNALVRRTGK